MYGARNRKKESGRINSNLNHNVQADSLPVFETINGWLSQSFREDQDSIAIKFDDSSITYKELQKLSSQIANYLRANGIKKGDRIGICLKRSIEMIASIIGILKAGAAYVPLDPNYPADRLQMMQEDAGLSCLIIHEIFTSRFTDRAINLLIWENIQNEIKAACEKGFIEEVAAKDVAYVIFTSGSTGRPKGIAMPHRALSNLIEWQLEQEYFKNKARVLQYSSISFDVSFQEIATTLASGGTLYLIDDEERRDARILLERLQDWKIERIFTPFVALRSLIEVAVTINSFPKSLKEVITAGEQLRVDAAVRMFFEELEYAILDNQYGPSETHVISSHLLGKNPLQWPDLPPIGKPLKNTSIYILDKDMHPVKDGEAGELYLAGRNLAHGYIGRDDLTRKAFIPSPFKIMKRPILYKTGDLGYYNEEGDIEFLGRSDHQIKIRGYRVEPGEINITGAKFPGVAQCLTHAIQDESGKLHLATYYLQKNGAIVDKSEFRNYLAEELPAYMVPSYLIEIDAIPYTPSGKVAFKQLPWPQHKDLEIETGVKLEYESPTQAELAHIWEGLLGLKNIMPAADFFELGGDSLMAVTLFLEIEKKFNKVLPLSTLVQAPTLQALSHVIEAAQADFDLSDFRSLQLIQKGDANKVPLFLIHGGAGNVLMFRELAEGLDSDIPIFAFQWSGWDGSRGENNIMEMARSYANELRKIWPSGPYLLGGHCIGGIIALEIARLLREDGAEVLNPILAVDSPNLNSDYYYFDEPDVFTSEAEFRIFEKIKMDLESCVLQKEGKADQILQEEGRSKENAQAAAVGANLRGHRIKQLPFYNIVRPAFKVFYKWLKYFNQRKKEAGRRFYFWYLIKQSKSIPMQERTEYSGLCQIHAVRNHKKRRYDQDILYLRSLVVYGRNLALRGWWSDLYMGFGELCERTFDPHIIGGKHNDVLKNPVAHHIIRQKMFEENKL